MIRFGALAIGVALFLRTIDAQSYPLLLASIACLVVGVSLLIVAREPFPRCCPHCPVYSRRRQRAERHPGVEATEIIRAVREQGPSPDHTVTDRHAAAIERAERAARHETAHENRLTARPLHAGIVLGSELRPGPRIEVDDSGARVVRAAIRDEQARRAPDTDPSELLTHDGYRT